MVTVQTIMVTEFATNCYILSQVGKSDCLIIDPGGEAEKIKKILKKKNLKPQAILLTHGHIDHIGACSEFDLKLYINERDLKFLEHPELNLSIFFKESFKINKAINTFKDKEILSFKESGLNLEVIHTPGHTPGSSCFLIEQDGILFSGDTIFRVGVGRTDFPEASWDSLLNSILKKIFTLRDEIKIYPGHGPPTNLGYEKKHNPFLGYRDG